MQRQEESKGDERLIGGRAAAIIQTCKDVTEDEVQRFTGLTCASLHVIVNHVPETAQAVLILLCLLLLSKMDHSPSL